LKALILILYLCGQPADLVIYLPEQDEVIRMPWANVQKSRSLAEWLDSLLRAGARGVKYDLTPLAGGACA